MTAGGDDSEFEKLLGMSHLFPLWYFLLNSNCPKSKNEYSFLIIFIYKMLDIFDFFKALAWIKADDSTLYSTNYTRINQLTSIKIALLHFCEIKLENVVVLLQNSFIHVALFLYSVYIFSVISKICENFYKDFSVLHCEKWNVFLDLLSPPLLFVYFQHTNFCVGVSLQKCISSQCIGLKTNWKINLT